MDYLCMLPNISFLIDHNCKKKSKFTEISAGCVVNIGRKQKKRSNCQ